MLKRTTESVGLIEASATSVRIAVELAQHGQYGTMVASALPDIVAQKLEDIVGKTKTVPMDSDLLLTAKALGGTFGD